jgi:hypothetical protein
MAVSESEPSDGGVKVVFDVLEDVVDDVVREITAADFVVRRYYSRETDHRVGGPEPGWVRLGAEQPVREFTEAEEHRIVAAFDAALQESAITCRRMGTDVWTAGGRDGASAGDRDPRPAPITDSQGARE